MTTFRIQPHGRLQEWVAEEHGYFNEADVADGSGTSGRSGGRSGTSTWRPSATSTIS